MRQGLSPDATPEAVGERLILLKGNELMRDIVGKRVYTENGETLGFVYDVTFEGDKLDLLNVQLNPEISKAYGLGKIALGFRHIVNIGEVVMVDNQIMSHLAEKLNAGAQNGQQ
jgi:sporulation protein YlmC with PRC-barrel domain